MKLTLDNVMKSKWSLAGLVAALVAFPNLGKGVDALRYVLGTTEAAYAGKAMAEKVDEQFERYIERQDAVAEALNSYVQQQAQQQLPMNAPAPTTQYFTETDQQGCWECWGYSLQDCDVNKRWIGCR